MGEGEQTSAFNMALSTFERIDDYRKVADAASMRKEPELLFDALRGIYSYVKRQYPQEQKEHFDREFEKLKTAMHNDPPVGMRHDVYLSRVFDEALALRDELYGSLHGLFFKERVKPSELVYDD